MVIETRATLMTQAPIYPHIRPDRAVISVAGDGTVAFLHNLLTVDLLHKVPGEAAYGALLTPQGKILHDVFLFFEEHRVLVDCAAVHAQALLQKLMMYRLRAKLEIKVEDGLRVAVGLGRVDPRFAEMGLRCVVAAGTLPEGDKGEYEILRLTKGLADSVGDIGTAELFVHEANLDLLGAVSFTKGCYVGQEVVSRTHHRGTARSRIMPLMLEGNLPAKGTEIVSGSQRIGEVFSGFGQRALGLIRLDRYAEVVGALTAGGTVVSVEAPVWMKK
jgi:tRNA-modifying protein YgfZ